MLDRELFEQDAREKALASAIHETLTSRLMIAKGNLKSGDRHIANASAKWVAENYLRTELGLRTLAEILLAVAQAEEAKGFVS